jgi:hypothetical protein
MSRQINPVHAIPFYSSKFILIFSSHLHIGFYRCPFLKVSQPKPFKNLSVQIRLRVGVPEDVFLISGSGEKDISLSPKCTNRLWNPLSLLSKEYQRLSHTGQFSFPTFECDIPSLNYEQKKTIECLSLY